MRRWLRILPVGALESFRRFVGFVVLACLALTPNLSGSQSPPVPDAGPEIQAPPPPREPPGPADDLLTRAIAHHDLVVAEKALVGGARFDAVHRFLTPLIDAADSNQLEMVKLLLEHGAPVDGANDEGATALHAAAFQRNPAIVRCLLAAGANAKAKTRNGTTPLHVVSQYEVNSGVSGGGYPQYRAQVTRHNCTDDAEVARLLCDAGAEVDAEDYTRATALAYAASDWNEPLVQELLGRGASIAFMPPWGANQVTPDYLIHPEVMQYLRDHDVPLQLFGLLWQDRQSEFQAVLQMHPTWADTRFFYGAPMLMYAIGQGRLETVQALLAAGADPNRADHQGLTPLMLATRMGRRDLMAVLFQYHAQSTLNLLEHGGNHAIDFALFTDVTSAQQTYQGIPSRMIHASANRIDLLEDLFAQGARYSRIRAAQILPQIERVDQYEQEAQLIYDRSAPWSSWWDMPVMLVLVGLGGLAVYQQRKRHAAVDKAKLEAEAKLHAYHPGSWGDDGHGNLGLYPEEQRRLESLRQESDGVLANPLPAVLAWSAVAGAAALDPYWARQTTLTYCAQMLGCVALIWVLMQFRITWLRIALHALGLFVAVVAPVGGTLRFLVWNGIHDYPYGLAIAMAGVVTFLGFWPYRKNLKRLMEIHSMEQAAARGKVHQVDDLPGGDGWDHHRVDIR